MSATPPSPARRRRRLFLATGALVIAGAVAVGAVLLTGGEAPPASRHPAGAGSSGAARAPKAPRPHATFKVEVLTSIPSSNPRQAGHLSVRAAAKHARARKARARRTARTTARRIRSVMERLYTAAFLDVRPPASRWLHLFATNGAQKEAWTRRGVLTIGRKARQVRSVREQHGALRVRVLFDHRNRPLTAYAVTTFRGVGRIEAGGKFVVASRGRFFLQRGEHGWVITGFGVQRHDRRKGV